MPCACADFLNPLTSHAESARGRREGVSGVPRAERPARPSEQMIVPVQADLVHAPVLDDAQHLGATAAGPGGHVGRPRPRPPLRRRPPPRGRLRMIEARTTFEPDHPSKFSLAEPVASPPSPRGRCRRARRRACRRGCRRPGCRRRRSLGRLRWHWRGRGCRRHPRCRSSASSRTCGPARRRRPGTAAAEGGDRGATESLVPASGCRRRLGCPCHRRRRGLTEAPLAWALLSRLPAIL